MQIKKYVTLLVFLGILNCAYEAPIIEWENGYIPYYYSGNFSTEDILVIEEGMHAWEAVCGVKFEEVTPRSNAYEILKTGLSNEWSSSIGENNVQNFMYYGNGSDPFGHVIHELGHCLGLLHEHQRPDRDLYIMIIWEKIYPEYEYNFDIKDNPLIKENDFLYDCESIMHYHETGFSIDGSDTIVPIEASCIASGIGQRDKISDLDAAKCRAIYGDTYEGEE